MEFIFDEKGYYKHNAKPIKYIITDNNCWECISNAISKDGYPSIRRNGKFYGLHRYSYLLNKGEIPKNKVVMHICDNPKCINPEHLKLGTPQDNIADMTHKGRARSGMKGKKMLNLTEEDLNNLKQDLIEGKLKQREMAEKYSISITAVSNIKNGKSPYSLELNGGLKEWTK